METFVAKMRAGGSKIQEIWQKLSLNQKLLIGGAALMVVVAIVFLLRGTTATTNEVLYTGLDTKDASAVTAKLDEYKITYELQDNGTTILVDPAVKYKTRLKLAGDNLPRSESGFELFQTNNYGETQTDKKVKYQVALQGELARTIQSLEKVKSARVHLVMPEKTLYSDKEELPSASVAITTQEDESLNPKEIKGIINLIANSVEGLTPDKVVIVDHNGKLISQDLPEEGTTAETLQTQLAMKKAFEQEKQQAIQSMLDLSLGKGNSVVRVNADLNFNAKEEKSELYTHDPEGPFVRSEHVVKESGTNTTTTQAAVPGTDTNITQYTQVNNNTPSTSATDKSDVTRNYEINRKDTVIDYAAGETKYDYLTVAVLVNNAGTAQAKLGNTEKEKVEKIRNIVATASGLRENRKDETVKLADNISVAFIDFYTKPVPEPATGIQKFMASPYAPFMLAILVLLIVLLTWLLIRRRDRLRAEAEAAALRDAELAAGFESIVQNDIDMAEILEASMSPEEREKHRIRQEIDRIIEETPENAAQVLRTWLMEDQR